MGRWACLLLSSCLLWPLAAPTEPQGVPVNMAPPANGAGVGVHKRFEYKYSFKAPYLAQKDGTVPFFEYSGNAIASEESVRITPSLRSQKGMIWSKLATNFDWWEVELQFRVTGRGRIGADGLAFWYTQAKGLEGPVFGSSDMWNGLGIFFDSFDNDNKHNNPYIMAMGNDGTLHYDHANDGSTQQLAGCLRDFRNKPFPVRAKIEFYKNILTVLFHNGMSNNDRDFEVCLRVENVNLPKTGYFGVSAATGGLADDHDVLRLSTYSLRSPEMALVPDTVNEQDSKKFEMEFEEYQKKLKDQKDQWAKEHPDQVKPEVDDWDNFFSDQDKELQQIFQGQSDQKTLLTELNRKLDEVVGRQERTLSMLSMLQQGGQLAAQGGGPGAGGAGQVPFIDTIRRDEVNAVLANQKEIVMASRDIKNYITDIHSKTGQLLNRGSAQPVQTGGGGGGADYSPVLQEMKESLNLVRRDLATANQRLNSLPGQPGQPSQQRQLPPPSGAMAGDCPQVNCVSTTIFIALLAVHMVVMISYLMYRDNKEAQAKKFY